VTDEMPATPILVLGTHHFAPEVDDLVEDTPGLEVVGFVENLDKARCVRPINGKPVHWVDELAHVDRRTHLLCALGTTKRAQFVDDVARFRLPFARLLHPSARISRRSTLGEGSIASTGVIVAAGVAVGRHVIMNRGVLIGHDTTIEDFVTISPGANIAGRCLIGSQSYIAQGAIITDGRKIGCKSVVGAGAVVTRDVPDRVMVIGVPARVVKENIDGR
jgi:acetyltransferase EpsM